MTAPRKTPLEPKHIEPQMCSIDLRLTILRQLPFFNGLPDGAIAEVNPLFREQGLVGPRKKAS